jgi:hypothetical protein
MSVADISIYEAKFVLFVRPLRLPDAFANQGQSLFITFNSAEDDVGGVFALTGDRGEDMKDEQVNNCVVAQAQAYFCSELAVIIKRIRGILRCPTLKLSRRPTLQRTRDFQAGWLQRHVRR